MLISEKIVIDDDKLHVARVHDFNAELQRAAILRGAGVTGFSENRLVGSVPAALVSEWAREAGVQMHDRQAMQEVIKRKMLSGEFSKFRVWEGTY